mgnify:CR=1 FL=1
MERISRRRFLAGSAGLAAVLMGGCVAWEPGDFQALETRQRPRDTPTIALPFDIPTPDTHLATGLPAIGIAAQVSDVLLIEQNGEVKPWLAESWQSEAGRGLTSLSSSSPGTGWCWRPLTTTGRAQNQVDHRAAHRG